MDGSPRRSTAPFVAAGAFTLVVAPLVAGDRSPATAAGAPALAALLTAVIVVAGRRGWPRAATSGAVLGFFVVFALLRHGAGGAESGFSGLVLLPMLWFALHGTKRELQLALAGTVVSLAAPILLLDYPATEWQRVLTAAVVAPLGGFAIHRLVNQRSALLGQVERLARTDPLTGALNRRAWDETIERELSRVERSAEPCVVALLDVDHFKRFNDTHGHQAGDRLLREAVAAWTEELRAGDVLARYGGEEFAVLLPGCEDERAHVVLDRLRVATPDGQTCSAGWTTVRPGDDGTAVTARADEALYAAKAAGRDCITRG